MLQQQQHLGRGFGASKMHLSPPPPQWLWLLSVLRRWLCFFLSVVDFYSPTVEFYYCPNFGVRYFVSILVLQSSGLGKRELVALLCLSSCCLVIVVWVFLTMPRVLSAVCDCGIS